MTTGDWAFILLMLVIILCTLICMLAWKMAYADGHEAGRLAERSRQNMRRIRENRERRAPAVPALVGGQPPWAGAVAVRTTATRTEHMLSLPVPATEPIAHVGAGRFPHILTSTGEFQVIAKVTTDRYIEQMHQAEEDYRKALTS